MTWAISCAITYVNQDNLRNAIKMYKMKYKALKKLSRIEHSIVTMFLILFGLKKQENIL